jgi:hypothetical protein
MPMPMIGRFSRLMRSRREDDTAIFESRNFVTMKPREPEIKINLRDKKEAEAEIYDEGTVNATWTGSKRVSAGSEAFRHLATRNTDRLTAKRPPRIPFPVACDEIGVSTVV